ncbi:phosphatase [bacterium]|nr:phosphatase [bacterium]
MILYVQGDLFESPAQVLLNTVNTVGVMGKGVALQFKQLFPEMFEVYRDLCEQKQIDIGKLWLYKSPNKWVLNFPTKRHWRHPSKIEYIVAGLEKFVQTYDKMGIHSIAFPPLGCGNGQLDFESQVQPLMHRYLGNLPIDVFIYPDRNDPFVPEHLSQDTMKSWLRSEPASLPFSEVWDDLSALLNRKSHFSTAAKDSEFQAYLSQDGEEIIVESSGRSLCTFSRDELMSFWQQLRGYGFSMRQIATGIHHMSYLIAIFAELPYVKLVRTSERFDMFGRQPSIGLQVLPTAFTRQESNVQPSLFDF